MTSFKDSTLAEFALELASDAPTPGGGSASGVALSQAGALAVMVADLTTGRERYLDGHHAAVEAKGAGLQAMLYGNDLADRDASGYDAVVASFKLPKDTDDEKATRRAAIASASIAAAGPPMEIAELALNLLETLPELARLGNQNAITDVGVSSLLASAACRGGLFNARINIIGDESEGAQAINLRIDEIRSACSEHSRAVMGLVNAALEG
ncbi:MAG: Methenyltetrahydrofolate cyclohydrolase [Methanobacteriota archaeon]|nr:MAG: Methenyltetrahydrofolate cyclohydrolase [Euryarchaeota archaeon]|tara:strand:+ start:59 stop:691 length:633 start_codon:yes stop_codon:yes gene_type:complete